MFLENFGWKQTSNDFQIIQHDESSWTIEIQETRKVNQWISQQNHDTFNKNILNIFRNYTCITHLIINISFYKSVNNL